MTAPVAKVTINRNRAILPIGVKQTVMGYKNHNYAHIAPPWAHSHGRPRAWWIA